MRTFADAFLRWYESLRFPEPVPEGIEVLDPRGDERVRRAVRAFAERYYRDRNPRIGVFGINPGRFGAGVTGIIFTDPVALREECGIPNDLGERRELSGTFVYRTIAAFGVAGSLLRPLLPFGTFTARVCSQWQEPQLL